MAPRRFEGLVADALDSIGEPFESMMDNVVVVVEDEHPDEPDLLGLYEGVPLTERDGYGLMDLPDQVTIFRVTLCDVCSNHEELLHEIRVTVVHEIAHHFGIDDDRLHELGWG
ncbi:MAG: metallopeptidase family protein [Acidimicrobiales bacterium]